MTSFHPALMSYYTPPQMPYMYHAGNADHSTYGLSENSGHESNFVPSHHGFAGEQIPQNHSPTTSTSFSYGRPGISPSYASYPHPSARSSATLPPRTYSGSYGNIAPVPAAERASSAALHSVPMTTSSSSNQLYPMQNETHTSLPTRPLRQEQYNSGTVELPPPVSQPSHPRRHPFHPEGTPQPKGRGARKNAGKTDDTSKILSCDGCDAMFARKHDLDRHRRIHTLEAPYICRGCKRSYRRSDARKRHWDQEPGCGMLHAKASAADNSGRLETP